MALNKAARAKIPPKEFAGPGRSYPIEDKAHAKAALMDAKFAPPSERAGIKAKAERKLNGSPHHVQYR
jgi:hypothetical protein